MFLIQTSLSWGVCALGRDKDSPNSVETEHAKETNHFPGFQPQACVRKQTMESSSPRLHHRMRSRSALYCSAMPPEEKLWAQRGDHSRVHRAPENKAQKHVKKRLLLIHPGDPLRQGSRLTCLVEQSKARWLLQEQGLTQAMGSGHFFLTEIALLDWLVWPSGQTWAID